MDTVMLVAVIIGASIISAVIAGFIRAYRWTHKGPNAREFAHAVACVRAYIQASRRRGLMVNEVAVYESGATRMTIAKDRS